MNEPFDTFAILTGLLIGTAVTSVGVLVVWYLKDKKIKFLNESLELSYKASVDNALKLIEAEKNIENINRDNIRLKKAQSVQSDRFYTLLEKAWVRNPTGQFARAYDILALTTEDRRTLNRSATYRAQLEAAKQPKQVRPKRNKSPGQGVLPIVKK